MTRGCGVEDDAVGVVMAGGVAYLRTLDKMRPSQSPMRASLGARGGGEMGEAARTRWSRCWASKWGRWAS